MSIEWSKVWEEITKASAVAILGPAAAYAGTLAKNWFARTNARTRQSNLCDEADRLIKFHTTLAGASISSSNVQIAKTAVVNQLDRVLDRLCQDISPVSTGTSRPVISPALVQLENWLLLYRPVGILSGFLHLLFYLIVPIWALMMYINFHPDKTDQLSSGGERIALAIVFTLPVVICNYLARKVDTWTRRRRDAAKAVSKAAAG